MVECLLENGANMNIPDSYGRVALYIATRRGNDKVVSTILDYKPIRVSQGGCEALLVEIDYPDKEGITPLFKAAKYNFPLIMSKLLSCGANPNVIEKQNKKNTPLIEACTKNFVACVKILLKYNADPTIANWQGNTALHICCKDEKEEISRVLLSPEFAPLTQSCLGQKNQMLMSPFTIITSGKKRNSLVHFILGEYERYVVGGLKKKLISKWSVCDVANFIEYIGYPEYVKIFTEHNFNGEMLSCMTTENLNSILGITLFQSSIINKVEEMKAIQFVLKISSDSENDNKNHFSSHPIEIGRQYNIEFSELELGEVIGKGYFGEVRKAKWKKNGLGVAVKYIYKKEQETDYETKFKSEISLLSGLRHPNIINFIGWSKAEDENFPEISLIMVTEFMDGGTLDWLLKSSYNFIKANPKIMTKMVLDIIKGLTFLHSKDILHRDLNTKNILLDEHYMCKISDFGLSRFHGRESTPLTTAVGFLCCMAPEVFLGQEYSFSADIYSFGIVLYHLVTGTEAYANAESALKFANQVANFNYRAPFPESLPPFWCEMISSCWDASMDKRPAAGVLMESIDLAYHRPTPHIAVDNTLTPQYDYIG
jgi:ankyrin repeat protein